jgi:hypothetical protein
MRISWGLVAGACERQRRRLSCVAAIAVGLLPLSCAHVMETTVGEIAAVEPYAAFAPSPLCHASLGAYFLPRSTIKVEVAEYQENGQVFNVLEDVKPLVRPDSRRVFCLDHLTSVLTSDQVIIKKTSGDVLEGGSQLLTAVASNSIDQSAIIIRRAIRTAFTAMTAFRAFRGTPGSGPQKTDTLARFEFDPFDQLASAQINDRLKSTGFCLVLEHYTYSGPLKAANAYCKDPTGYFKHPKSPFAALYAEYDIAPVAPRTTGVVYRPRVPFQLHIFMKDDPKSKDDWVLRRTMKVSLENISPILSLGVDRALFTQKRIGLTFDKGSLQRVCIHKKSEALAAVEIPLEVVKSIVKLPTEILQIQYDEVTQSQKLVKAQTDLLRAQDQYLALLNSTSSKTDPASGNLAELDTTFGVTVDRSDLNGYKLADLSDLAKFADCELRDVRVKP